MSNKKLFFKIWLWLWSHPLEDTEIIKFSQLPVLHWRLSWFTFQHSGLYLNRDSLVGTINFGNYCIDCYSSYQAQSKPMGGCNNEPFKCNINKTICSSGQWVKTLRIIPDTANAILDVIFHHTNISTPFLPLRNLQKRKLWGLVTYTLHRISKTCSESSASLWLMNATSETCFSTLNSAP